MKNNRIFWGVMLLLAGVVLLLNTLGFLPEINVFTLLFSLFLVALLIKSIWRLNFAGVLFPAAILTVLYKDALGLAYMSTWTLSWTLFLAASLGSIGLSLIFTKPINRYRFTHHSKFEDSTIIDIDDADIIRLETNFGSSIKYVNTTSFEQANLECSFGGMKVYFDNAQMKNDQAIVRLEASFSGVELYFPKDWRVVNHASVSFGAVEERNHCDANATHTVHLYGDVSFGGVEIYYV